MQSTCLKLAEMGNMNHFAYNMKEATCPKLRTISIVDSYEDVT